MDQQKKYITQKMLAERWVCSQGTIINHRNKGIIPFFQIPGSSRILYCLEDVEALEQNHTNLKGGDKKKYIRPEKKGKPVVSENPKKIWRI